ncbi:hypothetical protein [Chryseobacterium indoltheticum]|uniref:hypothetical protein n=1 Tax=Chryseobacterium indoltheticum TaxID=254 RepID=UPI003F495314
MVPESLEKALELDPSLITDMQKKYPYIKDEVKKVKAKAKIKRRIYRLRCRVMEVESFKISWENAISKFN